MIETALVYIYSVSPAREFVGCGALVEGGYIATCHHVWRDATDSQSDGTGEPPEVEIEFPFAEDNGVACGARLANACEGLNAQAPDLVLLKPHGIPGGVMSLQLAREPEFETGPGQCHCCLKTRDIDSFIDGEIRSRINLKGMRQFTGSNGQSHWMEEGSSGSPVFLKEKAQQLAGIIALAEVGPKKRESRLCEAFIVPATTIHKYLRALIARLAADAQAEKRGIDPAKLQPILAKLGQMDVPDDKIAERLDASVEEILAQAAKPVPVLAKLGEMDVPDDKIAEPLDAAARETIVAVALAELDKTEERIAEWRSCVAGVKAILAKLGEMDVPDNKIVQRLEAAVDAIRGQAGNDRADIESAIKASREKLGALDTAGALDVLQAKLDEEGGNARAVASRC